MAADVGTTRRIVRECGPDATVAGAILTIDLGAIRHNYRHLRAQLAGAPSAAVVKANGYGLGAAEISQALIEEGCDTFFVAHLSEGLELRQSLGEGPSIYVLNGLPPGGEDAASAAALRPVLNSLEQLAAWQDLARKRGRRLTAAIQVDSGMSRLGMAPEEVERIAADPDRLAGIEVSLVMSHLACADEPLHPANELQRRNFESLRARLPTAPVSFANSSGVFLDGTFHFNLGRPGVALYGVNPTPDKQNPMRPVVRLDVKVVQTREIGAGSGVGYGHALVVNAPTRLATIALGYADGWHRRAAGAAWFGDTRLPFAGRVSMDSIIVDASALPAGALKSGDLLELIGPHQSVEDVAAYAGTIGYEILTGLGRRFHRRYVDG